MIERTGHKARLHALLGRHPIVAILGARQVGKTTMARQIMAEVPGPAVRFDLEDPDDLARLDEPKMALQGQAGLVVIDEIQRRPELFPVLRVLADRPDAGTRFLILGSASPDMLRQSSETLAGRIAYYELDGFIVEETGMDAADRRWLRGGFPRAFLADSEADSAEWRREFIRTFLERDLPQLGIRVSGITMRRFWEMLGHYHGQLWAGAELARSFGVAQSTVRRYLDILTQSLVIQQLPPWHENIRKRQVKSPKIYIRDSGLLHSLLRIETSTDLERHPKVGASWEGFVLQQVISRLNARPEECFFWATHGGAELDLLVVRGARRFGFEVKRTTSPRMNRSAHAALSDLGLERLDIIHAGGSSFPLRERVRALAFSELLVRDLASGEI